MRIGILTLHSGYNEGAILQALALRTNLARAMPAAEVEIIDHRYPSLELDVYGPPSNERERCLRAFVDQTLPLSPRRFISERSGATLDYVRERYDAVVVGSDEVWKVSFSRRFRGLIPVQNDPWSPAFPNVYWLDARMPITRIAYAATVGAKTVWTRIPRRAARRMRDRLSRFQLIGIRDDRTRGFLEWLDPALAERAEWVPDPTFSTDLLGDVDADALKAKLESLGVDPSRPTVAVVAKDQGDASVAVDTFRRAGRQIVSVALPHSGADVRLDQAALSPLEWARTFGLMEATISQRMHGCIFSLLNGTPLVAVDNRRGSLGYETKIHELMTRFGLMDYYVRGGEVDEGSANGAVRGILEGRFPLESVRERIAAFREHARRYTAKVVSAVGC